MSGSHRSRRKLTGTTGGPFGPKAAASRLAAVALLLTVLVSASAGGAFGVVGGRRVSVAAAPWTMVVWKRSTYVGMPAYAACTGVIIDPLHILTAGHCVMAGDSAKLLPVSAFRIEAGVSNFKHPLSSDHPQSRSVSAVRVMPGYVAVNKITNDNDPDAIAHDVAVLTLSRALDLRGRDARVAYLPNAETIIPTNAARLVMAGFGNERPGISANPTGDLNEVTKARVLTCATSQVLCIYQTTNTCWGDSGSGAVEPGRRPTVVGILSAGQEGCRPGLATYVSLTAPATMRFIRASR